MIHRTGYSQDSIAIAVAQAGTLATRFVGTTARFGKGGSQYADLMHRAAKPLHSANAGSWGYGWARDTWHREVMSPVQITREATENLTKLLDSMSCC